MLSAKCILRRALVANGGGCGSSARALHISGQAAASTTGTNVKTDKIASYPIVDHAYDAIVVGAGKKFYFSIL